jgi:hypothetical protein
MVSHDYLQIRFFPTNVHWKAMLTFFIEHFLGFSCRNTRTIQEVVEPRCVALPTNPAPAPLSVSTARARFDRWTSARAPVGPCEVRR